MENKAFLAKDDTVWVAGSVSSLDQVEGRLLARKGCPDKGGAYLFLAEDPNNQKRAH